jgi:hypothetical protein
MKVLKKGHLYELSNFEHPETEGQKLQFIEKDTAPSEIGIGGDGVTLYLVNDGTTNEEILEMLIDRLQYLQGKFPCKENACCITHLEEGLMWLEKRTKNRIQRNVEGKNLA